MKDYSISLKKYRRFIVFVKSIFKDSFNEIITVVKDVKLVVFTLIVMILNLTLQKYQTDNTKVMYIFLLPTLIISLLLNVYQYIAIPELITTKEKNMVKFFKMKRISYWTSFIKVIKALLVLILVTIGTVVSVTIIAGILGMIGMKIFSLSKITTMIIAFIFGIVMAVLTIVYVVRLYLYIPLVCLGNVNKPMSYSWELSKGKFWKLALVLLLSMMFMLPSILINLVFKSSPIMLFVISVPLSCIISNIMALISINSLYYALNKDLENKTKETLSFETI